MGDEMLLLGAGASMEAGVPDAKQMAKEIVRIFNEDNHLEKEAKVLNFVNEQLISDARKRASDSTIDCVDIEALYNAILLLSERETLEISPFVAAWHPDLERIADANRVFKRIMLQMELRLRGLTFVEDERKVDYLKPILNLARNQNTLSIATLNYDNTIELLSRANGVACDTGVKSWVERGFFEYQNDGISLLRLHGSNYWFWSKGVQTYEQRLPHTELRVMSAFDKEPPVTVLVETPMAIFGQRNKLTTEGPFLDLLKQFDEQLQKTNLLTVVGYSFRDPHINFYITKFLNLYGGKIRVVDPNFEESTVEYAQELQQFREVRSEQIDVVEKRTGDALQEMYP